MSYTPTNWQAGDIVTAASMNKIEQGIAGAGVFIVHSTVSGNTETLDKTWQEIYNASGQTIVILIRDNISEGARYIDFLTEIYSDEFAVRFINSYFGADFASGYPYYDSSGEIVE